MILEKALRWLDVIMRHYLSIYEFCHEEECLLRLSITRAEYDVILSDGTCIRRGDPIAELHLWNEHVPSMPEAGPDLKWGYAFLRQLNNSMIELAAYTQEAPRVRDVRAFRGKIRFGSRYGLAQLAHRGDRWGFELVNHRNGTGLWQKLADFADNFYALGLMWLFNPASLNGKGLRGIKADEIWISRDKLLSKYSTKKKSLSPCQEKVQSVRQPSSISPQDLRPGRLIKGF